MIFQSCLVELSLNIHVTHHFAADTLQHSLELSMVEISHQLLEPLAMVADLCHVVLSPFRGKKPPRENPPNGDFFLCFRMATFRPATRKYATFHALRFRLLFVVSLPGVAKGRHAKTRQKLPFGGFSRGDLSRFRPENTFIRHDTNQPP